MSDCADTRISIKDYIDRILEVIQDGVEKRAVTLQQDMQDRFDAHKEIHVREREMVTSFKTETEQWRSANNEFRQQLTLERTSYVTKAEIWWMLSATALFVTTTIGLIGFIVWTIRGGH